MLLKSKSIPHADSFAMILVPKYVFWVTSYPKTASGKIQKFKLKETGLDMVRRGSGLE